MISCRAYDIMALWYHTFLWYHNMISLCDINWLGIRWTSQTSWLLTCTGGCYVHGTSWFPGRQLWWWRRPQSGWVSRMLMTTLILALMPVLLARGPGARASRGTGLVGRLPEGAWGSWQHVLSDLSWLMAAIADLPVQQEGFVNVMAFQDEVEVGKMHVVKSYMISYMMSLQAKYLPAHNMERSRAFTRSGHILLNHQ